MNKPPSKPQLWLTRLVLVLAVVLIVAGVWLHGFSAAVRLRLWHDIVQRPDEPMTFRFVLQPAMAILAALRDGIRDGRMGRSGYVWTILTDAPERRERLLEGLGSTARIILLGLVMDTIYQLIVLKSFYPVEAVIVAFLLGFLPYLLLRGPIARVTRYRSRGKATR